MKYLPQGLPDFALTSEVRPSPGSATWLRSLCSVFFEIPGLLRPGTGALRSLTAALLLGSSSGALAEVHYVDLNSTNATPPYTNWTTAATNIQDAVDAAVAGDEIVVTNGTYATSGRSGRRVNVDKAVNLHSANGPQVTVIDGGQSVGCVYLPSSAILAGFTVTNGYAGLAGAGILCESLDSAISNCVVAGNVASGPYGANGGGVYSGTLNYCILSGNLADSQGGGAYQSLLSNCVLADNRSGGGGGASYCTLNHCTLSNNAGITNSGIIFGIGGGAYNSTLRDCALIGNRASGSGAGGGASQCSLNNCTLEGNSVDTAEGGGAHACTLTNCTLTGNTALGPGGEGGGAFYCTAINCTFSGNAALYGGGAYDCTLKNCILYYNMGENYDTSDLNYCCTTPLPPSGFGNIASPPAFVGLASGNLHLLSNSPCINRGNNSYVTSATDLDGHPRVAGAAVDIGAYEFQLAPRLTLISYATYVVLTWSTNVAGFDYTGYTLQSTTNLLSPVAWVANSPAPSIVKGQNTVTNLNHGGQIFYRLMQ